MFDSVRQHQKILQAILLVLIFPSFVFLGIESYKGFSTSNNDIVKIGDLTITQLELDNAVKSQSSRLGSNQSLAQTPAFKNAILNQLIQQKLLAFDIKDLNLQVSSEMLAKELLKFPEIVALKKSDGSIDTDKYRQLLENNGLTVSQFEAIKRSEIMNGSLQNALSSNGVVISSSKISDRIITSMSTEREVQAMFFTSNDYLKTVQVQDSDISDYYQANPAQFQSTPSVDVEYITFSKQGEDETTFAKKADQFANMVYEQADSLKPTADTFKLKIESQADLTTRGLSNLPKSHPLNQAKLLQAIFKEDSLKSGKNIEAIEVSPGVLVAARVVQNHPAATLPFEKVKADIEKIVALKKAEEAAIKAGMEVFAKLQTDPTQKINSKEFTKPIWVSRNRPADLAGEPFERIFNAKEDALPKVVSSNIPGSGFAIYKINQVRPGEKSNPNVLLQQYQQIGVLTNQAEIAAYLENIKDRSTVKFLKSSF
ncbi:peptidylprolyl isomerase [Polynucleobacter kasalickyi]|uniref:PPIC-type PPIASE domain-containing protein n=1 Tax=Polynucleobacter kasalickyi TaxID=1938817 RepID=A0A1W2BH58_9BURK|nr:peptidylprolyl isomerase [Polynucleobacter kasalickyi]SMC72211.1 PPIC-type PPIASE domain-containing protein [Polynucleobacter kasalickyi]